MKKLLLLSLLILVLSPVFGQTYTVYYTTKSGSWGDLAAATSIWNKGTFTGKIEALNSNTVFADAAFAADYPGTLSAGTSLENRTPDIVMIKTGHTVTVSDNFYYNGLIVVEPGAVLNFHKVAGDKGRLVLGASSYIDLRKFEGQIADITSTSVQDAGIASNQIQIGSIGINGRYINLIPSPGSSVFPNTVLVNEKLLECIKGISAGQTTPLTEAQLVSLASCAGIVIQPVEMLSYQAKAEGAEVVLDWAVAKEWDFSHYLVEWSADGKHFYQAGVVAGKGAQGGAQYYSFRHQHGQAGTLYYRLSGVDIDGTVEVKGVKAVRVSGEVFNVFAAQGRIHINYNGPIDSQVALMDTMGRLVVVSKLAEEGVETQGLKAGIYLVQISNTLEKKTQRVIIR